MILNLSVAQLLAVIAASLMAGAVISYSLLTGQIGGPL
jgi:hypothetical protein